MHIRSIRESLELGSYLLPSLSGLPNPYKPPLLFWMGMASDSFFGVDYLSERLVAFAFGIGTMVLLYRLVFTISKSRSETLLTTLLFGFSFLSLKFFGLLMMEGPMVFFLLFYFYSFYFYKQTKQTSYLIIGSLVTGIGYLLKGPIIHVYVLFILLSYFYVKLIRIRSGKITFQWNWIYREKFVLFSFVLTFILPLIWISFLYFQIPSGKDLLRFFFITENIGKFYSSNQSGLRIWLGWLIYTIPFTIPLVMLVWNLIRSPKQIKHQIYVSTLLVFFVMVTCLHLLPNRKDPYYVTPFISFLFLLPAMQKISWQTLLLAKLNRYSILIIYFILLLLSIVLRLHNLFIFSILGVLIIVSSLCFFQSIKTQWRAILITQILVIPILIFFLLKPLSDPDLREVAKEVGENSVCVVAENPWTAMDVQNKLINTKVKFALPLTIEENCSESNYLISFIDTNVPNEFHRVNSWFQWKQHLQMNVKSFVSSLFKMEKYKFQTEISLWKKGNLE
ncbi:ArnT family glycosyltransferase [Leptospira paudalimensis]|uniref:Phospholipid carrier-dependent glycosyltransferase n=1 Tax=Leptospira paudalimensis TaxID=2950024 RepID=A0ABT3M645_9LEPT|nr:phospholipid carrier-dependent glycosyltransferase [Leptospira paudalimensis]MCW7503492.1 phospholipid carrier-dependent glycosyltransferase [Leptospira paudalimensis]